MHKRILFGVVGALLLMACAPLRVPVTPPDPMEVQQSFYSDVKNAEAHRKVDNALVAANTAFAFKFFSRIAEVDNSRNILISPSSMAMLLAMLHSGAEGETRQEIAGVLELPNIDSIELNRAYQILGSTLAHPHPETEVVIANSLWARPEVALKPEFVQDSQTYYRADIRSIDLSNPQAVQEIDAWAKEKTGGLISEAARDLSPDAVSALINTLYFKGRWFNQFDPEQTKDLTFTLLDGTSKMVPMMSQKATGFGYYQGNHFQAVQMRYGSEGVSLGGTPDSTEDRSSYSVSMYIFLPDEDSSLAKFLSGLTMGHWIEWMKHFPRQVGTIVIPRFRFNYDIEANDILSSLGMTAAFDAERADFSNLASGSMYVGKIGQKTVIDVNEEGTTAAALSYAEHYRSARITTPFEFIADRPFFFAIRDDVTGSILFMGTVIDPQQ